MEIASANINSYKMPDFGKPDGHIIVLADGKFPENQQVLNLLKTASKLICCDGATNKLVDFGLEPHYIAGDLDSIKPELKERFTDRLYYSSDQETNDLTKAIELCVDKGFDNILILGATGLREDHMLANISLLVDYAQKISVNMLTDYGVITPILSTSYFESKKGQQVSIFSLTPSCPVVLHGLKYPVNNRPFLSWWEGTLNESMEDSFQIEFQNGQMVVFREYLTT